MDLSGVQKFDGTDIRRRDRRETAADRRPTAELIPVATIDATLHNAWQDIVKAASEPNIFYEQWFLQPALDRFEHNQDLRLFLLWNGGPYHSKLLGLWPIGAVPKIWAMAAAAYPKLET